MKRIIIGLAIVVMTAIIAFAGETRIIKQNTTISGLSTGTEITGTVFTADSSWVIVDRTTTNDIFDYADDSLAGTVILITSGTGSGQAGYVWRYHHDASHCSLWVLPRFTTKPVTGDTYKIIFGVDERTRQQYPYIMDDRYGWYVLKNDTTYSEAMKYQAMYSPSYQIFYHVMADTFTIPDTVGIGAVTDSFSVRIWAETSPDNVHWGISYGSTTIEDSLLIADFTLNASGTALYKGFPVSLPIGTEYFRIGVRGNANANATLGKNYLTQWIGYGH